LSTESFILIQRLNFIGRIIFFSFCILLKEYINTLIHANTQTRKRELNRIFEEFD
jgi:hypothetical protein